MPVAVIAAGCERQFLRSPLSAHRGQLRVVRRVRAADGSGVALALYLPSLSPFEPRPRDWPQQLRALITEAVAAAGQRPLRELRVVGGFAALMCECAEDDRDRLMALLAAGGCNRLRFEWPQLSRTQSPWAHHWPPSAADRELRAAFLVGLTALPELTELSIPQLALPLCDPDAGALIGLLQQLRSLRLGAGVPQSDANLAAVAALPQLTELEWAGWSAPALRKISSTPPPSLTELTLRDEPRLALTATSPLTQLPGLRRLALCNVPEMIGRYAHVAVANLAGCKQLTALELQMDNADGQ